MPGLGSLIGAAILDAQGKYDSDSQGQRLMLGSIGGATESVFGTIERELSYNANIIAQNFAPDPQTCIGLYYAGRITASGLKSLLQFHAIDYEPSIADDTTDARKFAWHHAIDLAAPRFGIEQTRQFLRKGLIDSAAAVDTMMRHGFTRSSDINGFLSEFELLDPQTLVRLYMYDLISERQFIAYMRKHGISIADAQLLFRSVQSSPTVGDSLAAFHRQLIGANELKTYLKRNGYTEQSEQDVLIGLSLQIPPPQDLVMFSVREVWNDQVVQRFGYDQEFPEPFKYWMKKQGYDWSEDVALGGGNVIPGVSWPEAYWRAHWKPLSPDQAYTMLHRLRGNVDDPATWRVPGVRPFTMDDVRTTLKVQDSPPSVRDQLAAISYLPLRLVDIRNALARQIRVSEDGAIADRSWAVEQFQDRGHNLRDATVQAEMAVVIGEERRSASTRLRANRLNAKWIDQILAQYRDGMFSADNAIQALVAKGVPNADANNMIVFEDVQLSHGTFKEVVQQIKRDYLSGRIDRPDCINRLQATGMTDTARLRYIGTWDARKSEGHVFATAAKAVEFYKRGFLTYDQATRRLRGLGLWEPDAFMLLAAAQQDMDTLAGRAAAAESTRQAARAKALQRLADQAAQLETRMRSEIRKLTPPTKVQKWLKDGVVGEEWARQRLRAMGFPQEIVDKYISEVLVEEISNGQV